MIRELADATTSVETEAAESVVRVALPAAFAAVAVTKVRTEIFGKKETMLTSEPQEENAVKGV